MQDYQRREQLIRGSSPAYGSLPTALPPRNAATHSFPLASPSTAMKISPMAEANSTSKSKVLPTDKRRGLGKFMDFGTTTYTTSTNENQEGILSENNGMSNSAKCSAPKHNDHAPQRTRKPTTGIASKNGNRSQSLSDEDGDASSDELNLTDASAPIESPVKPIRSSKAIEQLPWKTRMSSRTGLRSNRSTVTQPRVERTTTQTPTSDGPKSRSPRRRTGKSKINSAQTTKDQASKLVAALNSMPPSSPDRPQGKPKSTSLRCIDPFSLEFTYFPQKLKQNRRAIRRILMAEVG